MIANHGLQDPVIYDLKEWSKAPNPLHSIRVRRKYWRLKTLKKYAFLLCSFVNNFREPA